MFGSDALKVIIPLPFEPSPIKIVLADSSTPNGAAAAVVPPIARSFVRVFGNKTPPVSVHLLAPVPEDTVIQEDPS